MNHFLIEDINSAKIDDEFIIDGENAHYMNTVLRLKKGNSISISNGNGLNFFANIIDITNKCVKIKYKKQNPIDRELDITVDLYQGIPKSGKMDIIIQKMTELGCSKVCAVQMSRSISIIKDKIDKKLPRYNDIALNASNQSLRQKICDIEVLNDIESIPISDYDIVIVAYELENNNSFHNLLNDIKKNIRIALIVGPEGGFEEDEINYFISKNAYIVSLGKRILRTETAAMSMMSAIMLKREYDISR